MSQASLTEATGKLYNHMAGCGPGETSRCFETRDSPKQIVALFSIGEMMAEVTALVGREPVLDIQVASYERGAAGQNSSIRDLPAQEMLLCWHGELRHFARHCSRRARRKVETDFALQIKTT